MTSYGRLLLLLAVVLLLCETGNAWRRRRRRRCATHSCTWKWGACSKTCGGGTQSPIKTGSQGACGSCSMPSGARSCNTQCCRENCYWVSWANWGTCSRSCGGGTQDRFRGRKGPTCGGSSCSGPSTETRSCNGQCCPVDCAWAQWGTWGTCSSSCGGGMQFRGRGYSISSSCGGKSCPGVITESRTCNENCCPVNCHWENWSEWGVCSLSCGGGLQSRSRGENPVMSCGGDECTGAPTESRQCNAQCCPVNCAWGAWSDWSQCSRKCGGGTQSRGRDILVPKFCGGNDCVGQNTQTQNCNEQCCPVDCKWNQWSDWNTCTKTCEKGTQDRTREIAFESFCGGKSCAGSNQDTRFCNDVCCTVHCQWEPWTSWSSCAKTCGGGLQHRERGVKVAASCKGEECLGTKHEVQACNTHCCAVDCVLSPWTDWSECSTTCGARGIQTRHRNITQQMECGGKECDLNMDENHECNRICFNGGKLATGECECVVGWTGECCQEDIDECSSITCTPNSKCFNTDGSYECVCNQGYTKDNGRCLDVDECQQSLHDCHDQAECINEDGHYICLCDPGFTGDGTKCSDIDECTLDNTTTDYYEYNYVYDNRNLMIPSPLCHDEATCSNTYGSYICQCNHGYSGTGLQCEDIDECQLPEMTHRTKTDSAFLDKRQNEVNNIVLCDLHATCKNSAGSYDCWCNDGYYGNGFICHETNECDSQPCLHEGTCIDQVDMFTCLCKSGYTGSTCEIDIDECLLDEEEASGDSSGSGGEIIRTFLSLSSTICHKDATCSNTHGSYICLCNQGFTGNGIDCIDIDECSNGMIHTTPGFAYGSGFEESSGSGMMTVNWSPACHSYATCKNTVGSYECKCNDGYHGDGKYCTDIHECDTGTHGCDLKHGKCINNVGSYQCICEEGYSGDGSTCADVNECILGFHSCIGKHQLCLNTDGSYSCVCEKGYLMKNGICEDINECQHQSHNCNTNQNQVCVNTDGGFQCRCKEGFHMNEETCKDIDECSPESNLCNGVYQTCRNTEGSYRCECQSLMVMVDGECQEQAPNLPQIQDLKSQSGKRDSESDDVNLTKTISSPPVLAAIILSAVLLVATLFLAVQLYQRRFQRLLPISNADDMDATIVSENNFTEEIAL
ncbi:uncharacterized protein LOC120327058 isoform X2 [Styela clava]